MFLVQVPKMSKLTGFPNTTAPAAAGLTYRGIVENMSIPADLHQRPDGRPYASFGSVVPIHCCTPEQVTTINLMLFCSLRYLLL